MIFLDEPYISDFLRKVIADNNLPVVDTAGGRAIGLDDNWHIISEAQAIERLLVQQWPLVYTASENCLGWIADNMKFCRLPEIVAKVKNKAAFRKLVKPLYPDYYFREVALDELDKIDINELKFPFVIKPTVGFFSLGVYILQEAAQWGDTLVQLTGDVGKIKHLYPTAVLDTKSYIIEEIITGREFAFDGYFDSDGEPVMLNIMEHYFDGVDDVSDRIYVTSAKIISEFKDEFESFLRKINKFLQAKNFVLHVEVRVGDDGIVRPIEVNPLRFGGWCTTADLTWYAYGENSYLNYLNQNKPNWDKILNDADDSVYALIVLDNSTGVAGSEISDFYYDKAIERFDNVLELRKINWKKYPLFGYFFAKVTSQRLNDLNTILTDDLSNYIT